MAKYISIANLKGGTGKTTLAAWLGYLLYRRGYKVLLVDLDTQGHLTSLFIKQKAVESIRPEDLLDETRGTVFNVLEYPSEHKRYPIEPRVVKEDRSRGGKLSILPSSVWQYIKIWQYASPSAPDFTMGALRLRDSAVGRDYEYVIIDCPPDPTYAKYGVRASDYILIPTDGTYLSIRGTILFITHIFPVEVRMRKEIGRGEPPKILGVVPVKVRGGRLSGGDKETIERRIAKFIYQNRDLATYIHKSPLVFETGIPQREELADLEWGPRRSGPPIDAIYEKMRRASDKAYREAESSLNSFIDTFLNRINNFTPYITM